MNEDDIREQAEKIANFTCDQVRWVLQDALELSKSGSDAIADMMKNDPIRWAREMKTVVVRSGQRAPYADAVPLIASNLSCEKALVVMASSYASRRRIEALCRRDGVTGVEVINGHAEMMDRMKGVDFEGVVFCGFSFYGEEMIRGVHDMCRHYCARDDFFFVHLG